MWGQPAEHSDIDLAVVFGAPTAEEFQDKATALVRRIKKDGMEVSVRAENTHHPTDLVRELESHGIDVVVYDPLVEGTMLEQLGLKVAQKPFEAHGLYDGVILAVPHKVFREKPAETYVRLLRDKGGPGVLLDVRGVWRGGYPKKKILYWSL